MSDLAAMAPAIRQAIDDIGYSIVDDAVAADEIAAVRDFWLATFAACKTQAPVIWTPYFGEPNRVLYHRHRDACLYRSYDYLWNEPIHGPTRDLGIRLNRVRNRVVEADERYGETLAADRYAVYVTTSYYPSGDGRMTEHCDRTDGRRHWHFILPLTFKGADYASGGLVLTDRRGKRIDVDGRMRPGSVIFYDGTLPHAVEKIGVAPGMTQGRLQMFAIPTFIDLPETSDRLAERIPVGRYAKDRLRPFKRRLMRLLRRE